MYIAETTETRSPKADATRTLIVDTAERLFRTLGYQKTTVADIARDAGMSPANVYRFFASKAAINQIVAERLLSGLSDLAWAIARRHTSPAERIRAIFRAMQEQTVALFFTEKTMHDMVAAAMDEHWPVIQQHIETVEGAIRHIVMDGQANGSFARLDPQSTAKLIHASMVCFIHPQLVQQCKEIEVLPAQAEGMAELMLRALRHHPDD
jgi:AcrR family transcriptional regulator